MTFGAYVDLYLAGRLASAAGWGLTPYASDAAPAILQTVDLPIVAQQTCVNACQLVRPVTAVMICAGDMEGGTGTGGGDDDGGPLIVDDQIIGITSWRVGCGWKGYPSVFAHISTAEAWINSQLS